MTEQTAETATIYNVNHVTNLDIEGQRKKLHVEMAAFLYGCAGVATIFLATFKLADHFPALSWWALPVPLLVATAFLIARLALPYVITTIVSVAIMVSFIVFLVLLSLFVLVMKSIDLMVFWWPKGRNAVRGFSRKILTAIGNRVDRIKDWVNGDEATLVLKYAR